VNQNHKYQMTLGQIAYEAYVEKRDEAYGFKPKWEHQSRHKQAAWEAAANAVTAFTEG
jgi:hypothetical protein